VEFLEQFAIADWNQGNDQRWDHPKCEDQRTADKEDDIEEEATKKLQSDVPARSKNKRKRREAPCALTHPIAVTVALNDFEPAQNALFVFDPLNRCHRRRRTRQSPAHSSAEIGGILWNQ
jgi:hypothetical protein